MGETQRGHMGLTTPAPWPQTYLNNIPYRYHISPASADATVAAAAEEQSYTESWPAAAQCRARAPPP